MNWRDLLYFSKGERRALALLLCLITISWILLLWTNTKRMPIEAQTDAHRTENRQAPGERRIITGKNTSEGGKNFIRKESGPHPNKTKNGIIYFRLVTHLYRINTFYWIAGVKTPCYFYKLDE